MAQRRMFSLKVVDSDAFMDMGVGSQLLYFHLSMRADDDGFVGNPKKIMRMIGSNEDDLKILLAKRFLLSFDSGIIVIKHWKIHNYIQNDRYQETQYLDEKRSLLTKENGSYTECIQNVSILDTQVRLELGKDRIGKDKLEREEVTPAQESKDFFSGNVEGTFNYFKDKGLPETLLRHEFQKFISYWTEKNKSGTKQRWETERTFEVRRRLATWLDRVKNFTNKKETKII